MSEADPLAAFARWYERLEPWQINDSGPLPSNRRAYLAGYAQATTDLEPTYEALCRAALKVCVNLPAATLEEARAAWGNTNTAAIYHWINNLRRVLGKPLIGEQAEADAAKVKPTTTD